MWKLTLGYGNNASLLACHFGPSSISHSWRRLVCMADITNAQGCVIHGHTAAWP
jgi:hypothetical protein